MSEWKLPDGWRSLSLGEVADVVFSNVDKKAVPGEKTVLLCNYMDVYSNEYITHELNFMVATANAPEIARFSVQEGDVIATKDSETPEDIGVPAVVVEDIPNLVCGYHLAQIKPDRDTVDPVFLSKQIAHDRIARYFSRLANGSTRYGLSTSSFEEMPVWLPELSRQRKIARILTTLDELIEKTEALIAKYQVIKQGLMHDLFTRGVDKYGHLRPSYEDAPELYKESELGWIPKEWDEDHLGDVCNWTSGGTPSKSNPTFWTGTIPWVSPKDMKVFDISDSEDHITGLAAHLGSRLVPAGTVFIVIRGMILAHSFPVAITAREMAFNQDIKALVFDDIKKARFVAHWFVSHRAKMVALATESTHGTKRFDLSDVYAVPIGIPQPDELNSIVAIIDSNDAKQEAERKQLGKLRLKKQGLMQDLLTGEVEVTVDEEEVAHA